MRRQDLFVFLFYNWINFIDSRMQRGHCVPTLTTDDCNVLQEESWPDFEFLVTVNAVIVKNRATNSIILCFVIRDRDTFAYHFNFNYLRITAEIHLHEIRLFEGNFTYCLIK